MQIGSGKVLFVCLFCHVGVPGTSFLQDHDPLVPDADGNEASSDSGMHGIVLVLFGEETW